ncbi:MAG: hypothetical protein ACR2OC_05510 [Solirubrobacterales bacterium]
MIAFTFGLIEGSGGESGTTTEPATAEPTPTAELPGGGTAIVPDRRVLAFYGAPQDDALGVLGIGSPQKAGEELLKQAEAYDGGDKPVLPAMELIAVTAAYSPGERGDYNIRQPKKVIDDYLAAAREIGAILILDIQPGYADFLTEVRRLEEYLVEPDVSLALDPEWAVDPPEIPGQVIGSMDASEVNEVSDYLQGLIAANNLPQKLLIIHQFTDGMIDNREALEAHPNVAIVLNSDGFSDPVNKEAKYDELRPQGPTKEFTPGFKLFYLEDFPVMTPKQVLGLEPEPEFIVYE